LDLTLHAQDGAEGGGGVEAIEGLVENVGGLGVDLVDAGEELAELEIDGGAVGLGDGCLEVVGVVAVEGGSGDVVLGGDLGDGLAGGEGGVDGGAVGVLTDGRKHHMNTTSQATQGRA